MEIVSSGDIFNEQKSIVFSVIVIAIPITLATIYKANKNKTTKQKIKKYVLHKFCIWIKKKIAIYFYYSYVSIYIMDVEKIEEKKR
ncbi:hypothetical protein [Plasmodium yoelii yoelii]|uniref:Uncharacterized protein n=1 Tax=Plasmodium yoelii yoelii TaxID=73239 RepID=Q7RIG8_PLAYO|nr:hypothetical protein [Plasmodium yoelii yoelii]